MASSCLTALSPEAQLVLLSAGGPGCDDVMRALLDSELDWAKVTWLAEHEAAVPVLWRRIGALGGARIPDEAATTLQRLAMVSEFQMLRLEQRLGEAIGLLEGAGIDVVLLKGAALACSVYRSFSLRPMGDADLLVERGRAEEAMRILSGHGWAARADETLDEFYAGHHHLPPLDDQTGSGARIELHTAFFFQGHPFVFEPAAVREAAETVPLGRRMVRVPALRHQVLHLCLHFVWSHMLTLGAWRTFRDLDALVAAEGFDWDAVVQLALESRGGSCCYWTFRLGRDLVGIEVPEEVLAALRPPEPEYVLRRVEQHFVYHLLPSEAICPSLRVAHTMWTTGVRPTWSGHGAVRPWDRSDIFRVPGRTAVKGPRKLARHLANVRGWARYLRAILHVASLPG